MGYRCPVCTHPQTDGEHLANHLAFTALIRGGDHEAWLDEHVADWEAMGAETLATRVTEDVPAVELPPVFEEQGRHSHHDDQSHQSGESHHDGQFDHEGQFDHGHTASGTAVASDPPTDDEIRERLQRARELTRKRRQESHEDS